jgi:class 3 adenylate cyclase
LEEKKLKKERETLDCHRGGAWLQEIHAVLPMLFLSVFERKQRLVSDHGCCFYLLLFCVSPFSFKVETIGDCYVAACGLPEKRDDHALVMARFARDCLQRYPKILREMTEYLGPGVKELGTL